MAVANIKNIMWWIDTMAQQTVCAYSKWKSAVEPGAQNDRWEGLMGRLQEVCAAINLLIGSGMADEDLIKDIKAITKKMNGAMGETIKIALEGV